MKVLIFSLEERTYRNEIEMGELNYDYEQNHFWMRCVMGADWFQRVTSSLEFTPKVVRFSSQIAFVVFNLTSESEKFRLWLVYAEEKVKEGYRTMRG